MSAAPGCPEPAIVPTQHLWVGPALVAVLVMENALALFESLFPEPWPLPVHGALSAIYLLTILVGSWLISTPDAPVVEERA